MDSSPQIDTSTAWEALRSIRSDFTDLSLMIEKADERTKAVQTVLNALVVSLKRRGYDRKQFQLMVRLASSDLPNSGPAAAQHKILLAEARKVLGIDPAKI